VSTIKRTHRTGSTSSEYRWISLGDEINMALSLFEERLKNIIVKRQFVEIPQVLAPPADVQHVFWNLIDNAIGSMSHGGNLFLEILTREEMVVLAVMDSGPGIPESEQARLFEPFVTSRLDGTGLGLSTAKRLARLWGGDLQLVPQALGARFEVTIPIVKELSYEHAA